MWRADAAYRWRCHVGNWDFVMYVSLWEECAKYLCGWKLLCALLWSGNLEKQGISIYMGIWDSNFWIFICFNWGFFFNFLFVLYSLRLLLGVSFLGGMSFKKCWGGGKKLVE